MSLEQLLQDNSALERLQNKLEKEGAKKSYKDDRFWYPARDKSGVGSAVIRFLPVRPDDAVEYEGKTYSVNEIPWVATYSHGYQNKTNGQWYIEECPTTIGLPCPMCEANSDLWNTGSDANKDLVRQRKRKLSYISNILVLSDKKNPENEGKVFLFKYGKKIYDKIKAAMNPEFDDVAPVEVFNLMTGADFNFRIKNVEGYANYDASSFGDSTPLHDGDKTKLREVYNSLYTLSEFISPERFKDYDALKSRLNKVLGVSSNGNITQTAMDAGDVQFLKDHQDGDISNLTSPESENSNEDEDYFNSLLEE